MIIVLDASAVVDLLVRSDRGERVRARLASAADATLCSVAHVDAEVLSALTQLHRDGRLVATTVGQLVEFLGQLAMRRLPISASLLRSAWALRDNVAMRDALYVAAAAAVDGQLVTTDDRLTRTVGDLAGGPRLARIAQ